METQEEMRMEEKIRELEEKISQLRAGRRILMNLLEQSTQEKMRQIIRLEQENKKLRRRNRRFAAQLLLLKTGIRKEDIGELSDPFV